MTFSNEKNRKHHEPSGSSVHAARITRAVTAAACVVLCLFAVTVGVSAVASRDGMEKCRSQVFDLLRPEDIPSDGPVGDLSPSGGQDPLLRENVSSETEDYIPLLLIVIGFENQPYETEYDWSAPTFRDRTSIAQYYLDMSFGKFTFLPACESSASGVDGNTNLYDEEDDGIIHVTLPGEKLYGWTIDAAPNYHADLENYNSFAQAVELADQYIDFSKYDSNLDGAIDTSELAIGFVVAGRDASYTYMPDEAEMYYSWPNAYSFSGSLAFWRGFDGFPEPPVVDGVEVDSFITIAESYDTDYTYDPSGDNLGMEPLGVLAHELGHYLGLPDLYDTKYSYGNWGLYACDSLSLMDAGTEGYDEDGNVIPLSLDIWSRVTLGWVEPVTLEPNFRSQSITGSLDGDAAEPVALLIRGPRSSEYFLIENRRFSGWDLALSSIYPRAAAQGDEDLGGGLIIWHIDDEIIDMYSYSNLVNGTDHHPGVMPLFVESDFEGRDSMIGFSVSKKKAFFSADLWGADIALPLYSYGATLEDWPDDRYMSALVLSFETGSAPVMSVHLGDWSLYYAPDDPEEEDPALILENIYAGFADRFSSALEMVASMSDDDTLKTMTADAVDAIRSVPYDSAKTLEENRDVLVAISEGPYNVIGFLREKEEIREEILHSAQSGDGAFSALLIVDASLALDELEYDLLKTPEENTAAARAILEQLREDLVTSREKDSHDTGSGLRPVVLMPSSGGPVRPVAPAGPEIPDEPDVPDEPDTTDVPEEPEDVPALPFLDVAGTDEWYGAVRSVYEAGIMEGVTNTRFSPSETLTRGMVVTVLYRLEGRPAVSYAGAFTDVPDGTWYTDGVEWAASLGIVNGYGDGTFGPSDDVTREQLAAILYRYAAYKGTDPVPADAVISDADLISGWAEIPAYWAAGEGILVCGPDGALRPGEKALRWEVAAAVEPFLSFAAAD